MSIAGLKQITSASLYRNSIFMMTDSAVSSAFGFIFWIIAARLYSADNVGAATAIISALYLLAAISLVGLNISIVRFLPETDKPQQLINSVITTVGAASLIFAIIFISGLPLWSPQLAFIVRDNILLPTVLAMAILFALSHIIDFVFVATRKTGFILLKNTIFSISKILLLVILVFFLHSLGILISWGIAILLSILISLFWFLPRSQPGYRPALNFKIHQFRSISSYSSGSYVASLLSLSPGLVLPLIVVNVLGTEANAYYYIACTVSNLLALFSLAISKSFFAEGSQPGANFKECLNKSIKFTLIITVPAVILMIILSKWILLAFGPDYSANALTLLVLLSVASLPRGLHFIYVSFLRIQNRIKELVVIHSIAAAATIGLSIWAIRDYGINGIGYVLLGTQSIVALIFIIRILLWSKQSCPANQESGL